MAENTYKIILNLLNLNEDALRHLQECVRELRRSYRDDEVNNIEKHKRDEYQQAYLLAYYPPYSHLIGEVLNELHNQGFAILSENNRNENAT